MASALQAFMATRATPQMLLDTAVYLYPRIPLQKIMGAKSSYVPSHVPAEAIVLLMDDTVFGGAREGLVLTDEAIYFKAAFKSPDHVPLSAIRSIALDRRFLATDLYIQDQVLSLTQVSQGSIMELARLVQDFIDQGHTGRSPSRLHLLYPMVDLLSHFALINEKQWTPMNIALVKRIFAGMVHEPAQLSVIEQRMMGGARGTAEELARRVLADPFNDHDARTMMLGEICRILVANDCPHDYVLIYLQSMGNKLQLHDEAVREVCEYYLEGVFSEDPQTTTTTPHSEEVLWACGVLEIEPSELTAELVQQAYRRKIKDLSSG